MRMKKRLLIYGSLLFPLCMSGQDPSSIQFVNTGKMNVAANATASLYVPWSVKMTGMSSIVQNGKTCIGGSFYQNASTNVFKVAPDGWGTSTGTISFMLDNAGQKRNITVIDESIDLFDRSARYIAFPNILIHTNDTINLPGRMGMDAKTVKVAGVKNGMLYLHSNPTTDNTKVFDASLRITGNGTASGNVSSANLVDLGSVVVERDLSIYRNSADNHGHTNYGALFGFASPFADQKAGYFAGNFVRTVSTGVNNNDYASTFWHAQYPYADEAGAGGMILPQYYVRGAMDPLYPSQAYLIRPQESGSDYSDLPTGFISTEGDHDLAKFIFNGKIYNLTPYQEQVFAEDKLISRTLNGTNTYTYNWVIGNSYTCALDVQAVANAMMNHPSIWFYEILYTFSLGSVGYQPYYIGEADIPQVIDLTDIPSQTVFMIRVAKGNPQSGTFTLDRRMLTHGKSAHNLRSGKAPQNELLFRLHPEGNPNIYDLATIGLRKNTGNSIEKVPLDASGCFSLYTTGKNGAPMSVNLLDPNVESVTVSVKASDIGGRFVLNISRIESLSTEGVWLKDLKTGDISDLSGKETFGYSFDTEPGDDPDRFAVFFRLPTDINAITSSYISCYYHNRELVVKGLQPQDENSIVNVIDMSGRVILKTAISNHPEMRIPLHITDGVYVAKITGKRCVTMKFIKK